MVLNMEALAYGVGMGSVDAIIFPIVKYVSLGLDPIWMIIPMIVYAFEPFILLKSLQKETLTVMNLIWDLSSCVLVTMIGLFYFNEKLSSTKLIGVLLSVISIALLTSSR